MRIAILADQHGSLPPILPCDLMILSGDVTGGNPSGTRVGSDEHWRSWLATDFLPWAKVPFVMTAGNHDTSIEAFGVPPTVTYLCDSGTEIAGLKLWGSPWVPKWDDLAFSLNEDQLHERWLLVPTSTDIIVAHAPPFGVGELVEGRHVGVRALTSAIERVKPKLVTCGHIHQARGIYRLGETLIINAARAFMVVTVS